MSDFGLQSDGYDLDLDPSDLADPDAVFGVGGVSAGFGTADTGDLDPSVSSGDPLAGDLTTAGYDSDGDGTVDVLLADENHDGLTDVAMWDTNGDGLVDRVAYDNNHDGKIDLIYHDDNFDGEVDRIESTDGTTDVPGYTSN
ncbi:hypothetical protein GCM10010399_41970 [Dactylosporangium fulvum]|uniref:EF-hand domain-containing protein n=1 Tax=Dactylosporangium fulvum TaxID=53359 RepID=A0ABY5VWS1_9ACTN|nr:hypothetical protein [Dactylosporangium fulvum]UWP81620.1 hypothetical protein Dfulv_41980 [Dactylosporangium fulvum]